MKTTLIITNLVCIIIIILLSKCNNVEPTKRPLQITFTTPEVKGNSDTIYQSSIIYKTIKLPSHEDTLLVAYLKDSINRLAMFIDAITERTYSQVFTDSNQEVEVYSKTRGELIEQAITYTIFPKTITIDTTIYINCPIKNQYFGSAGIGYGEQIFGVGQFSYINKKNKILSAAITTNGQAFLTYGIKF